MAKYAIVQISGHQYKVSEGDELLVDRLQEEEAPAVLLVADGDKVTVGTPVIPGAKVAYKILGEEKGQKVEVIKYRSKSRYRRHTGFRHSYTKIQIGKITSK